MIKIKQDNQALHPKNSILIEEDENAELEELDLIASINPGDERQLLKIVQEEEEKDVEIELQHAEYVK